MAYVSQIYRGNMDAQSVVFRAMNILLYRHPKKTIRQKFPRSFVITKRLCFLTLVVVVSSTKCRRRVVVVVYSRARFPRFSVSIESFSTRES